MTGIMTAICFTEYSGFHCVLRILRVSSGEGYTPITARMREAAVAVIRVYILLSIEFCQERVDILADLWLISLRLLDCK